MALLQKNISSQKTNLVEAYDAFEQGAIRRYSPYVIRMFRSQGFAAHGFQVSITSDEELWKFVDSQHEFRFERNFRQLLTDRLTEEEYAVFTRLSKQTAAYCKAKGFPPVGGRNALSRALIALRAITALIPRGSTVLEVGAGSGFVSAGLVELGYKVISYDVTQSLFLHQQSFFSFLFGNRYHCCLEPGDPIDMSRYDLCHIPWWNFADISYRLPPLQLLTINHALNEMPRNSVKFIISRVARANADTDFPKLIMEDLGFSAVDNFRDILLPEFTPLHFNLHMADKNYVPAVVMERKKNPAAPAAPMQTVPMLPQLAHTSFTFTRAYTDIEAFFSELPEARNPTMDETYGYFMGHLKHI